MISMIELVPNDTHNLKHREILVAGGTYTDSCYIWVRYQVCWMLIAIIRARISSRDKVWRQT